MKFFLYTPFLLCLLTGCHKSEKTDQPSIISMQLVDRNGFSETISTKDRIGKYKNTNFLEPQPYQKVLRVFSKNTQGKHASTLTTYHPSGYLWQYLDVVDGRANGFYREWYASGQMKMELLVIEGFADLQESAKRTWVFDGVCQVWDEDGQLIAKISYEKGMLDSPSLYYYPSGALKKQIPYHRGQIHGDEMSFDENGFILEKISYHEGKRQGDAISFFDPNHKQYEEWYEDGLLHKALYYNKEGNILSEISSGFGYKAYFTEGHLSSLVQIQQGIEKGKIELFAPSGKKISAYSQENGQKQGEEWIYYQEGASTSSVPKLYMNWDGDLLQGEVKTWYSSGALESQREFNQNKKHGTSLAWYKNGDLMLMEEYDQNSLIKGSYFKKGDKKPISKVENGKGTASIYSADGVFIKKISYEKGQPIIDK